MQTSDQIIRDESYKPTLRQTEAHETPERFPLFGGAMRGGKTAWLCNSGVDISMKFKNNRGYMCRHELNWFMKTTYIELQKWLGNTVAYHNKQYHYYNLRNGSQIFYGGLGDDVRAIERLKSLELGWFAIDQVEETTEKHFFMLSTRLNLVLPNIIYKGFCTANPKNNWVKDRWIDQDLPNHAFIPAFPNENPYNPPDYEDNLREMLPPELVQAWIEGDWSIVSEVNQVFPYADVQGAMYRESRMFAEVSSVGVDVATFGDDETVICKKTGNRYRYKTYRKQDTMDTADRVIDEMKLCLNADFKIDTIGEGRGVYDRVKRALPILREKFGFKGHLIEYKSSFASKDPRFINRRAEDYFLLRSDLNSIDIPLDAKLRSEMSIQYRVLSSDGLFRIESKDEFKKRMKMSPDRLDGIVMAHSQIRKSRKGKVYRR